MPKSLQHYQFTYLLRPYKCPKGSRLHRISNWRRERRLECTVIWEKVACTISPIFFFLGQCLPIRDISVFCQQCVTGIPDVFVPFPVRPLRKRARKLCVARHDILIKMTYLYYYILHGVYYLHVRDCGICFFFFPQQLYPRFSLSFSSLLFFLLPNYHVVSLDSIPIPARQKKSTGCHINDFLYKWRSESRFIFFFSQDETVANWTGCVIVQRITQLDGWQGRKLIQAITYIMATSRGFQSSTSTAGKDGRRLIHQDSLYVSAIPFSWA